MPFQALKDPTAILSPEQARAIVNASLGTRDRLLLTLLWRTGRRISEVLGLRWGDINWTAGTALIRLAKKRGEVIHIIPLGNDTLELLRRHKVATSGLWVFSGYGKSGHLTSTQAYNIVRETAERAGITEVGTPGISKYRHPHPHHFRHSFCAQAIQRLGNSFEALRTVQELVGHSRIDITASYVNISTQQLRQTYNKIWAGEGA